MDYADGKIYRIVVGDSYYYGSTVLSLSQRLYGHKAYCERNPCVKVYAKIQEVGWDSVVIELVEDYPCESNTELRQRETTYINLSDPLCLNTYRAYCSEEEGKERDAEALKKWRENNKEYTTNYGKEYRVLHPPTEEQKIEMRDYQREYMKKRRASLPKKERKKRTEEEITESKRKKVERDTKARKEATEEVKEQRRIRHNELQLLRRNKK